MSDVQEYSLRWRGRISGPFPVAEINRMLDDHEIGMGHEIFYQEAWITVEEFLVALRKQSAPVAAQSKPVFPTMALAPLVAAPPAEKGSPVRIKVSVTPVNENPRRVNRGNVVEDRPGTGCSSLFWRCWLAFRARTIFMRASG